jgi:cytochrome b6-f complex iron-sulfur subunit
MAEPKKMSVAEILAAARAQAGGGKPAPAADEPAAAPAAESTEAEAPAQPVAKPAPAKPAAASAGGRPSVADILAMARSKGGGAGATAAPAEKAAKPAAAKPAAEKPSKPAAKAAPAGGKSGVQRDTASILAAARAGAKPGPVSKAEAPPRPVKPKEPTAAAEKPAAAARLVPPMPTRPKPAAKPAADVEERRTFLSYAVGSFMAVGFTALSVTGGLFTLGLARYMFPNVLAEPPSKFKVGFKDGFPTGKVETKFVAQYGVWVVNGEFQGQQQIYALKTVCTHLGCTPSWLEAEQKFKCPCHGSGFYKDGINFEGPAPRPLERYAIRIADDGQLEIDKSRAFQEELGQWADPDSYVNV